MKTIFHAVAGLMLLSCRLVAADLFTSWPAGSEPEAVGKRVAENLLTRDLMLFESGSIHYPEACTGYGALRFAGLTHDQDLLQKVIARYAAITTPEGSKLLPSKFHVDYSVFGIVPLEIFLQTGDARYLEIGKRIADAQWEKPLTNGLTRQTRYWIDDMFMVGALQTQAFRATRDRVYADRVADFLCAYLDKLQQTNGLFFHGPDFHHFWGRGNGWVAVSLADALTILPKDHPRRARLMDGYTRMMSALLRYQGTDGLWRQLIDNPESWEETSCTGMFTYAFITGVKNGWLEKSSFGPAAKKGWLGLVSKINAQGEIADVCKGTRQNKDPKYYLGRPRVSGDLHGQAPVLWCANAFLSRGTAAEKK
ncbi:MAG: glycoside hydrolase family 88/105 protein [Verrucomicrobiota bacterium]